ncbi:hypothetical protein SAY87_021378 [Trapa incisa]|uniref:Uncharacterized protein n=1 Tax=Trapa incisa TaxID=236973 RepID=A0AAN7JQZ1_9MYRT|nr:hypothetical protein SAY87_021378 [Trapa incisa]
MTSACRSQACNTSWPQKPNRTRSPGRLPFPTDCSNGGTQVEIESDDDGVGYGEGLGDDVHAVGNDTVEDCGAWDLRELLRLDPQSPREGLFLHVNGIRPSNLWQDERTGQPFLFTVEDSCHPLKDGDDHSPSNLWQDERTGQPFLFTVEDSCHPLKDGDDHSPSNLSQDERTGQPFLFTVIP